MVAPLNRPWGLLVLLVLGLARPSLADGPSARGADEFNARVRPILARSCFSCHGPDEHARKAKLRLDIRDVATGPTGSGERAIVPGQPGESELVRRVLSDDPDERMPPAQGKHPLSQAEKQILKQWIADGAEYRPHWAFVPPRRPPLPEVRRTDWPRNPIDHFILARLEAEGLTPSPPADRATLARRLYLDLIGLPPTPEEIDAFVADNAPGADERLVDRLLASPHYGERWARRWLDLARYADTNGYEKDRQRSIWPYRDWVIRALNADLPFDRFTVEQLAGDMLPEASVSERVATGFHRNTMLNEEGGIDPLEFRFYAMTDRAATTGTVWLGLTLGCAQCHTHKFDPITHREYYQFMAFLNNADEPELQVPDSEVADRRRALDAEIAAREAELPDRFPLDPADPKDDSRPEAVRRKDHLERRFRAWVASESASSVPWTVLRPESATSNLPFLTIQEDGSVLASGDQSKRDVYQLAFRAELRGITAIRLDVLPDDRLPRKGPGRVYYEGPFGDFFLSEATLTADGKPVPLKAASHSFARPGAPASAGIDGDPQTGWSIDGGQGKPHSALFRLAQPLPSAGQLSLQLLFERYYAAGLGRFRVSVTTDPRAAVPHDMPPELEALLLIPDERRSAEQTEQLFRQYLTVAPELAKEREAIDALRKQRPDDPITLVFSERAPQNPRPTFLHKRGEFLQAADRVEPALLGLLPPWPDGVPRNRLEFARALVNPGNPLVGRVTMNRQWAILFGRGLVRTTQDFGYQGEPPSHPELLDWLAVEFVERGWSLKAMHRLLVTSATYQQASNVSPELLARDAENVLLARGPRVRLDAELIRDAALRSAGLLSSKLGGPSVFPPQPPGVTSEGTYGGLAWNVSKGGDRYRRGLYTFSKRTAPYAMATTFDGPTGEVCLPRREVSNTPLQALTLLNDAVFTEAAQALGSEFAIRPGTVEERVVTLCRRCLARAPEPDELSLLVSFLEAQRRRLAAKELDAAAIAGPGPGDPTERAAWTALARSLFNLDEFVVKG